MSFFRPNIDSKGRLLRGIGALAMGAGAAFIWPHSRGAGIAFAASSAFMAFEAVRGWCVARACGVKTKF